MFTTGCLIRKNRLINKIKHFFSRFKYQKGDLVLYYNAITCSNVEGKIEKRMFDSKYNTEIYIIKVDYMCFCISEEDIIKKIN